jgi:hypothetical protein
MNFTECAWYQHQKFNVGRDREYMLTDCHLVVIFISTNIWLIHKGRLAGLRTIVISFTGCQCPCGSKISPAFYLVPSKVEWSNMVQNVQVTVWQTTVKLQGKMEVHTIILYYLLFIYNLCRVAMPLPFALSSWRTLWFTSNSTQISTKPLFVLGIVPFSALSNVSNHAWSFETILFSSTLKYCINISSSSGSGIAWSL